MAHKFRIWSGKQMHLPEEVINTTYRYLLNRDGTLLGIDLSDMKWDGLIRMEDECIMFQIGRKDMSGQEIYDGDVVKVRSMEDGWKWLIGLVRYSKEDCGYGIYFNTGDHEGLEISFAAQPECKVLGHKFQEEMQKLMEEQRARFMDPMQEAAVEGL